MEVPSNVRLVLISTMCAVAVACRPDSGSLSEPENGGPTSAPELAVTSNTWISRADLPGDQSLDYAVAAVPKASGQSIVYVMGGLSETGGKRGRNYAYNVATNTWTLKASMPFAVYGTNGAGVINGKIYISGGVTGKYAATNALLMYNPATNTWTRKRDMPTGGSWGQTGVISGKLYVLTACGSGMYDCPGPEGIQFFYRYDPATDQWSSLPLPPNGAGGQAQVVGGKWYVVGGKRLDIYNPVTNRWTTGTPWNSVRSGAATAALNGKLYMIGGMRLNADGSWTTVAATSVYDPATNTWSLKAPLPTPRAGLVGTAVTLNGSPRIEVLDDRTASGNHLQYIP